MTDIYKSVYVPGRSEGEKLSFSIHIQEQILHFL